MSNSHNISSMNGIDRCWLLQSLSDRPGFGHNEMKDYDWLELRVQVADDSHHLSVDCYIAILD